MKYKVGQKVRIKSLEWYKENRNLSGVIATGDTFFRNFMSRFCGSVVTIESIELVANLLCYRIKEDGGHYCWVDEMIEGLVEEETYDFLKTDKPNRPSLNDFMDMLDNEIKLPQGYQFKDENGNIINATKIVLEKKKKEYPKTYEECCEALEYIPHTDDIIGYKWDILQSLQKLLICRDAYWKIAGEEIGLDKPWEPDWDDDEWPDMYYISWSGKYLDKEKGYPCCNMILIFPTEEMRDAFYENFKELIESCKELL